MESEKKLEAWEKELEELNDLMPQPAEVTIGSHKNVYHLKLRAINLEDRQWMMKKYGDPQKVSEALSRRDFDLVCEVVFRLLEDKSPFLAIQEPIIDDDGRPDLDDKGEVKLRWVTAAQRIIRACTSPTDQLEVYGALIRAIGNSNPKMEKDIADRKKKLVETIRNFREMAQREGEFDLAKQIGEKYSTYFPQSTDGDGTASEK